MRITQKLEQEKNTFTQKIILPNGTEFDHYDTIKKISLHREGKFHNCDDPKAVFYPLGQEQEPHFSKKLGIAPRSFKIKASGDRSYYEGWVWNMKFRQWADTSGFTMDMDDLSDTTTAYGSTVKKLVPLEAYEDDGDAIEYDFQECDFTKLYFNTEKRPINSDTVIEEHELTEYELRKKTEWIAYLEAHGKTLDDVFEKAEKVGRNNIKDESNNPADSIIEKYKIYERVGEFMIDDGENKGGNDWSQHGVDITNGDPYYLHGFYCGTGDDEIVLWEEELEKDDCPYHDFHLTKYRDRFLGVGIYERLFDLQKLVNELCNYDREAARIASLLLLWSKNKGLQGLSVIRDMQSGRVLPEPLNQIDMRNPATSEFLAKLAVYEAKAQRLCLAPEPNDDTVRGQILSTNEITTAFRPARNRILYKMFDILKNKIMPAQIAKWNDEEILEIAEDDIDIQVYDEMAVRYKLNQYIAKEWKKGKNPSREDKARFLQNTINELEREGRRLTGMKDYFKDKQYTFTIDPFGNFDNNDKKSQVRQWAIGMIMSNPAVANLPYFKQELEDNGIPPHKVSTSQIAQIMQASIKPPQADTTAQKPDRILSQVKENG